MRQARYNTCLFSCVALVCCSSSNLVLKEISADAEIHGIVTIDIIEVGHPDVYHRLQITPGSGRVVDARQSPVPVQIGVGSFKTGAVGNCMNTVSTDSADALFTAVCSEMHTSDGAITEHIDIRPSGLGSATWSRTFDDGWRVSGLGWNPTSPILAILINASKNVLGLLPRIVALTGHPPQEQTVHLLFVNARSKDERDYVIADRAYGIQRLLQWDSDGK